MVIGALVDRILELRSAERIKQVRAPAVVQSIRFTVL